MPLSHPQAQALPGDSSGSRKRTHAEITRSESRSQSPQPPSKRRRTLDSPSHTRNSISPDSTAYSSDGVRFPGDGLDYRRPIMSTAAMSQQQNQDTIDLTLDDDSPPPRILSTAPTAGNSDPAHNTGSHARPLSRAPPFYSQDDSGPQHIIDLSSDEEDTTTLRAEGGTRLALSSPEVQFIRERTLPRPTHGNHNQGGRPHLPTPPAMRGHLGSMANFLRDMTQGMFVNLRGPRELPEEALNRIDGLLNHTAMDEDGLGEPPYPLVDEYDGLRMDYGRTAFQVGNEVLLIDDPNLHNNAGTRTNELAYKEPAPAREGFTRNYEEDDMIVCGLCGDELATGNTDQKQQVWIIKQCGHAYCGDCAHARLITKQKNNRDMKRIANKKTNGFKTCNIPGCTKAVDSKTKMFQIYL